MGLEELVRAIPGLGLLDLLAVAWFVLCWAGYTVLTARLLPDRLRSLPKLSHLYRIAWMRRLLERDNRIYDSTLLGNLMHSVTFFASTTIIILAGLVSMLGVRDKGLQVAADLPFVVSTSPQLWEVKLLLLITVFVYAFFKLTWSLRQFNYCALVVGSAPERFDDRAQLEAFARLAARINSLAGDQFNLGLRAYYFGLASLSWFVHPGLYILVTGWIVIVLYRREFSSVCLLAMDESGVESAVLGRN